MQLDIREIQSGSEVRDADGAKLGMVVSVGLDHVRVKTDGMFAKEYFVPRSAIVDVEERRVEIDTPKSRLDSRGWDQPPAESAPPTKGRDRS